MRVASGNSHGTRVFKQDNEGIKVIRNILIRNIQVMKFNLTLIAQNEVK